jgi:hypothetical protein
MDKQKKQLIILIVLVVVGGGVGGWQLGFFSSKKKPENKVAGTPLPGGQPAQPNPGAGLPPDPIAGGAPGAKGPEAILDMPDFAEFNDSEVDSIDWAWAVPIWERGKEEPRGVAESLRWPADPFKVLNIDVVDPNRHAEIKAIIDAWKLEGVTQTMQTIFRDSVDDAGNPKRVKSREYVYEAWFKGNTRTFKEGDRLPNTRFKIERIFRSSDASIGEGVELIGDTGASLMIRLAPPSRH